jgi:hypothetical protein
VRSASSSGSENALSREPKIDAIFSTVTVSPSATSTENRVST